MAPKKRGTILGDTFETFKDAGQQIVTETAKSAATVVDVNAWLYGPSEDRNKAPTQRESEKNKQIAKEYGTKMHKQREKIQNASSTPLDVDEVRKKQLEAIDKQAADEVRKRLFGLTQQNERQAEAALGRQEQERIQTQQREDEDARQRAAQTQQAAPEESHGKAKRRLGQAAKKASTQPPQGGFEQKSNKGK